MQQKPNHGPKQQPGKKIDGKLTHPEIFRCKKQVFNALANGQMAPMQMIQVHEQKQFCFIYTWNVCTVPV